MNKLIDSRSITERIAASWRSIIEHLNTHDPDIEIDDDAETGICEERTLDDGY